MSHVCEFASSREARRRGIVAVLAVLLVATGVGLLAAPVAAVAVPVPYSATPVADADLDGNPATGAWSDAVTATVPMENGDAGVYGTATMYAKHDGTTAFFRFDGQVDVPWTSATGNHFWFGMAVSTGTGGHHGGGTWDGWYFGLWNGNEYAPQPTYPPPVVDTNGFQRPPNLDATQNALGVMRSTGAAAPYAWTAEWKRPLATGDASDIGFVANGATTYYFYASTDSDGGGSTGGNLDHRGNTNVNTMTFATPPVNNPPTVDLTTPDGGEVWTGGTAQLIRWNMSDAETATTSLRVWINYSTDGGGSYAPIPAAQGITGIANPATFSWTVPTTNTLQGRVRVTVADARAATASDASLANLAIDATPPTITSFTPADGATGVSPTVVVRVDFSEAMNAASGEQAFSLQRLDTSAYISGAYAWAGNQLTFTPFASLAQGVVFRTQVNATARDRSDPGNAMGLVRTATFTTADVTPPTIAAVTALPSPQEAGFPVNVSALVTDNGVLSGVWIEVRDPLGASLGNLSASTDSGTGRSFREQPYTRPGLYAFTISAVDVAGLWAVATGGFTIVDTIPPAISHTPVTQGLQNVPIRITATVTDGDTVADARADYTDVLGARSNVSLALNGTVYEYDIPGQPALGTLSYFLWAIDPTGNVARTPTYSVAIVGSDVTPPTIAFVAASPPTQDSGLSVNVTAAITDNVAVLRADVVITDPFGAVMGNFSMARAGATDVYFFERPYAALGVYTVVVWAVDTSDNNASLGGSFRIVDASPPAFAAVAATPDPQEVGLPVNISATVTDNVAVANVQVRVFDAGANLVLDTPMARAGDLYWITQAYASLGLFTFTLNAIDPSGNAATAGGSFTIVDTQAPVADAGPDHVVGFGTSVTFDGSGSTDNLGIANYTWAFNDGGGVTLFGVGPTYTFNNVGTFLVTLTVADPAGNTDADTMWVNATADTAPPVAAAGPGQTVPQGSLVAFDGSGSTDDVAVTNWTWTFVDGGPVTLWGAYPSHRFLSLGNVTVTLTVWDAVGRSDANDTWVNVVPDAVPPVARAGPDQTISLGDAVVLNGSASTDDVVIVDYAWRVERTGAILPGMEVSYIPGTADVWRFVLTVRDASGLAASDDVNVTVVELDTTPPAAPLGLVAATDGPGAIQLSWTPSPEADLAGYFLSRAGAADGAFVRLNADPLTEPSYVDAGLVPGQRYWYEVRAVDLAGNLSPLSNRADASAGLAPPAPFDWSSLGWAPIPLGVAAFLILIAFLARREGRRRGREPTATSPKDELVYEEEKGPPPAGDAASAPPEPPKVPP